MRGVSLRCTGELMCQRDDRRFVATLVTCRRVHVAKRHVRRCNAAPRTDGDEGAVSACLPWTEPIKLFLSPLAERIPAVVDVTGGHVLFASESRARIERPVGANRVRVFHVHVTRTVMYTVARV